MMSIIPQSLGAMSAVAKITFDGTIRYTTIGKLRVEGTQIVDQENNLVKLSGFNIHGIWSNHPSEFDPWIVADEEDLIWMKNNGFNSVRLVMYWEDIETSEGVYNTERLEAIDAFLDLCEKHEVYVLLDMHQWGYSSRFTYYGVAGHGIPDWAGPDSYSSDELLGFMEDMWAKRGGAAQTLSHFIDFWEYIVSRYKDRKGIFAYDLLNEPYSPWIGSGGPTVVSQYQDFFDQELAPAIRRIDPITIIAYASTNLEYQWRNDQIARMKKPDMNNIIFVASWYGESDSYDPANKYRLEAMAQTFYDKFHNEFGVPFMLSEIGGDMTLNNNLQWIDDSLKSFTEKFGSGANWLNWHFGKNGEKDGWRPRRDWPNTNDMPVVAILQKYN